jgi:hypothetical protein
LLLVGVVGVAGWMARGPLSARLESALVQRLAESGIHLRYARRSWSTWQGLQLEEVALLREATGGQPVVEVSALRVGISVRELLKTRSLISRWSTKDATVILRDAAGPIRFEHVRTRIVASSGAIETSRLDLQQGPRTFALSGKILLAPHPTEPTAAVAPFAIDLSTVREVLSVLNFKEGHPPFAIRGSYSLDLRPDETLWQADLSGTGRDVEWQGVPLRNATAQGRFSSAGMNLTSRLEFTAGSAEVSVKRGDWDRSPLLIAGSLTDGAKQGDDFSAAYQSAGRTLSVSSLRGKAHLLEFARNFPPLVPHLPSFVQFQTFPDLAVTDFSCSLAKPLDTWTVGSIETRSPADVTLLIGGDPLKISALEGAGAFADHGWKGRLKSGPLSWRNLSVSGANIDGTLAAARLQAKLGVKLAKGSAALDLSSADWSRKPLQFTGTLTDSQGLTDRITGSYQREPATLRIAQLSGRANLLEYATNFPGGEGGLPESFRLRTFPEIAVTDFVYRPGKTATLGSLRLLKPADITATIRGRPVALDHVEGRVGFDGRAWQLSGMRGQLFDGHWTLDGSYENGTLRGAQITAGNLHLAELKAWLGESPNAIGGAILAFDYRGNVGADFAQFTGTGSIRMENAPIFTVPLLDQTYALASVLVNPVSRRGPGRLEASFASTNGVAKVSQFNATSDAVRVTAEGTLDLRRKEVSGRARGNLRGPFGLATSPLSRTLEMQVSGPLDKIRVRPLGLKGLFNLPASLPGTAKRATSLMQDGVALPLRVFDLFNRDASGSKR